MPIEVELPGGQIAEFPDGMAHDAIQKVLSARFSKTAGLDQSAPGVGKFAAAGAAGVTVPEPSTAADVVKSLGSGLVKGGVGLAALPGTVEQLGRMGINAAAKRIGGKFDVVAPEPALPSYGKVRGALEQVTGPLYDPKTTAGEFAGAIGEFAPGMLLPAGTIGGLTNRAVRNVVAPALASEGAGQVTKGTAAEPYARIAGAMLGPSVATPFAANATRQRAVQALNDEGVTALTAGQVTGRKPLKWAESAIQDVPFSGSRGAAMNLEASEQFTRAALRRVGEDAPRATPDVIDRALTRIGGEFQAVSQAVAVPVTPRLQGTVDNIVRRYERITEPSMVNGLPRAIADDIRAAGNTGDARTRFIDGAMYSGWRSDIGAAARATQDPRTKRALYDLQHELDDAAESFLRARGQPEMVGRMQEARRHYRNMIVLEKAATGAGEAAAEGLILPSALRNATKAAGLREYARGRGDFAELARSGEAIMKPLPQSGTAPRLVATEIGKAVAGAGLGGYTTGGPEGAAAGSMMPILAQALMGRAVMSRPVQAYMRNQVASPGQVNANAGALARALLAAPGVGRTNDMGGR